MAFDPYVKLVGKEIRIRLVNGKTISGKLFQVTFETVALQRKNGRTLVHKRQIIYAGEILQPKPEKTGIKKR